MKKTLLQVCTGLFILIISTSCGKQHEYQRKINFNDGWKFHYGDVTDAYNPSFDDGDWREVDLPHDSLTGIIHLIQLPCMFFQTLRKLIFT